MEKRTPDYLIFLVVIILIGIGLVMILSASSVRALIDYNDSSYLFRHQLIWAMVGIIAMLFFMKLDYHIFQRLAKPILFLSVIFLILVLFIGFTAGGSRRWFNLGFVRIQPSEMAKLAIVIYLAQYFSSRKKRLNSFKKRILAPVIVLDVVFMLILLEPDLGTAVTITGIFIIMLFASGVRLGHIFLIITAGIPFLIYFIFSADYRRERFFSFLNPWEDPLDTGYHIIQSLLALGSGGIFGVGLGQSRQKFLYLPEPGTDFIFAVLGEELGLLGTLFVLGLFFILAWRGFKIAMSVPDLFGSLLAVGLTSMIIIQTIINIGVVTASMPVTGITLPFISYGGTSMVIMMSAAGILLNISREAGE